MASITDHEERPTQENRRRPSNWDIIDKTSDESFPASDPPSWTPVTGAHEPFADPRRSELEETASHIVDFTPAQREELSAENFATASAFVSILVLIFTLGVILYSLVWLIVALS